ncbi:MAG: hypothetical protein OEZ22_03445 [Spirochaetia bacterium]|nr:hypothetical protein [Spirochaetia bacterium]
MNDLYFLGFFLLLFAFILNIPFGYFRGRTKKYSFLWFLYIHFPIPFVAATRIFTGFSYKFIPFLVVAAILGQFIGSKYIFKLISNKNKD